MLADDALLRRHQNTRVSHAQKAESDHCFLLISLAGIEEMPGIKGGRQFPYENMWRRHETYDQVQVAKEAWLPGSSHGIFGSVRGELKKLRRKLE